MHKQTDKQTDRQKVIRPDVTTVRPLHICRRLAFKFGDKEPQAEAPFDEGNAECEPGRRAALRQWDARSFIALASCPDRWQRQSSSSVFTRTDRALLQGELPDKADYDARHSLFGSIMTTLCDDMNKVEFLEHPFAGTHPNKI